MLRDAFALRMLLSMSQERIVTLKKELGLLAFHPEQNFSFINNRLGNKAER